MSFCEGYFDWHNTLHCTSGVLSLNRTRFKLTKFPCSPVHLCFWIDQVFCRQVLVKTCVPCSAPGEWTQGHLYRKYRWSQVPFVDRWWQSRCVRRDRSISLLGIWRIPGSGKSSWKAVVETTLRSQIKVRLKSGNREYSPWMMSPEQDIFAQSVETEKEMKIRKQVIYLNIS